MDGATLISIERHRQVVCEGFYIAHDDAHTPGTITSAAQCYAEAARRQILGGDRSEVAAVALFWQWDIVWLKIDPDPIRNLVKAGALIAAEIDRLQRADITARAQEGAK